MGIFWYLPPVIECNGDSMQKLESVSFPHKDQSPIFALLGCFARLHDPKIWKNCVFCCLCPLHCLDDGIGGGSKLCG